MLKLNDKVKGGPPLISIIIPVYNVEEYLPQCIESVLQQTHHNLDIILINDGSTDGSGGVCDAYAKKDNRIRVIHQENVGVSSARNAGLDIAQGEWIGFVDADDWIKPAMYEKLLQSAVANNMQISCCNQVGYFSEDRQKVKIRDELPEAMNREQAISHCINPKKEDFGGLLASSIVHRCVITHSDHPPLRFDSSLRYSEDRLLFVDALTRSCGVSFIQEPLYYYRQRTGSAVYSMNNERVTSLVAYKQIIDLVKPISKELVLTAQLFYMRSRLYIVTLLCQNKQYKCAAELRRKACFYAFAGLFTNKLTMMMKLENIAILLLPKAFVGYLSEIVYRRQWRLSEFEQWNEPKLVKRQ